MRKLIPFLFVLFLISASSLAMTLPHPIHGHVMSDENPVKNAELRVRNTFTQAEKIVTTNEEGFYQAELANFDSRYQEGDTVEVILLFCEDKEQCRKTEIISGGENEISWDISEVIGSAPDTVEVVQYKECWDGTEVTLSTACPKRVVCEDGTEVYSEDECPEGISGFWKAMMALAIAVLGVFGWSAGFTALAKYWFDKGKELEKAGKKKEAKACYDRASKMLKTSLRKASEGKYKK